MSAFALLLCLLALAAPWRNDGVQLVHAWWKPTPGTSYQMQLSGELNLSYNVTMYDIDLFDTPASTIAMLQARGSKVICYFSAGTYEDWRPDKDSFTKEMYGKGLPDWKGEYFVDTRNAKVRQIMTTRIQMAKDKGCDGVDPDNVDGFDADSGFALDETTQLDFNKFLATTAHALDLSVGLKNDPKQIEELVEFFDFAVNEECIQFNACDTSKPFITKKKPVFGVEYVGDKEAGCKLANALNFDTLYKTLQLTGERYSCRGDSATVAPTATDTPSATSFSAPRHQFAAVAAVVWFSMATMLAIFA